MTNDSPIPDSVSSRILRWVGLLALLAAFRLDDVMRQKTAKAEFTAALYDVKATLPEPPGIP